MVWLEGQQSQTFLRVATAIVGRDDGLLKELTEQ